MDAVASGHMPRALVADGGAHALGDACAGLEQDGFEVERVSGLPALVGAARALPPDVIIIDIGVPGGGAVEACRAVREFSDAYVIVACPLPDEVSTVLALSVGADDVVCSGTSGREMAARARAMLRRPRAVPARGGPYIVGGVEVDPMERRAGTQVGDIDLTRTEFEILAVLAEAQPAVVERGRLVERVWGTGWVPDDHVLDVHVSNLRRKLVAARAGAAVVTVRGVGFRVDPAA